jgi:hypothetical protein
MYAFYLNKLMILIIFGVDVRSLGYLRAKMTYVIQWGDNLQRKPVYDGVVNSLCSQG